MSHYFKRLINIIILLTLLIVFGAVGLWVVQAQPLADQAVSMSCPFGSGGDQISRGFYITNFPGNRLDTVTLRYYPESATSNSTIHLIAHLNTYNGPELGTASVTGDFTVVQTVTYHFGVAVPLDSTIAFVQSPDGAPADGFLFYDTGNGGLGDKINNSCPGFVETEDTTPPLSVFRRSSIGGTITGTVTTGGCPALPSGSVVGALPNATQAYYAPGKAANNVILNVGTYWVIGTDATGGYYEILLSCDFLWVPVGSMQPSFQAPWNGQALPTTVVS